MHDKKQKMTLIQSLSRGLKVLYVEDDDNIRSQLQKTLSMVFETVIVASNGEEGLKIALEQMPDFIITDIEMPIMSGLEMAKRLSSQGCLIPIVVLTAYDTREYLLETINLKNIHKYLRKPFKLDDFIEAILDLLKANIVKDQKDKMALDINSETNAPLIAQLANLHPDPMIYVDNDHILYANDAFYQLTTNYYSKDLSFEALDVILSKEDGYLSSFSQINTKNYTKNKIKIKTPYGVKIFYLYFKEYLPGKNMYVFHDITFVEYQKHKKRVQESLHGVQESQKHHVKEEEHVQVRSEILSQETADTKVVVLKDPDVNLDEFERSLLRKTRQFEKISSKEYLSELDDSIIDEIQELSEIEQEIDDIIYILDEQELTDETLVKISRLLVSYSNTMRQLIHFQELAYSINIFADILVDIGSKLDESKITLFKIILNGILKDIKSWRVTIFIDQNAIDVHYLDSSLFSSLLQVKQLLGSEKSKEKVDDEDEFFLELF